MATRWIPWGLLGAALALVAAVTAPTAVGQVPVAGKAWGPGKNRAFHGVSDTGRIRDFRAFRREVRAKPAVLQMFFHWGVPLRASGALYRWSETRTRGVVHVSTAPGGGEEVITPRQIARGRGDDYILVLNHAIARAEQTVYIRLMAEMNAHWNPYSKYNADGTARGASHRTTWYRRAWRRFATIVRGGSRDAINRHLRRNKMPRILRAERRDDPIYERFEVPEELPQPRVAMMWVPQTIASPNVRGNQPRNYWPGRRYVDWVGADIYSKWATAGVWAALDRFFRQRTWRRIPFVIAEYSPYDRDPGGAFVRRLFHWAEARPKRVKMLIYYRSVNATNPHNIQYHPAARRALRRILSKRRYVEFAPGIRQVPREPPPDEPLEP
jgi:hypothetical protein